MGYCNRFLYLTQTIFDRGQLNCNMKTAIHFLVLLSFVAVGFAVDCPNGGVICAEGWEEEEVCIESHRRCDGYNDCGWYVDYTYDDEKDCEDGSWQPEWEFEENKYCSGGGKLEKLQNSSWEKARAACARNSECTMVVRLKCEKTNTFYLCKGVSKESPPKWGSCASYHRDRYTGDLPAHQW